MSTTLHNVSSYLKLIFDKDTPLEQRLGLIYTASVKQVFALIEIIHNVLSGYIPLSKKIQTFMRKDKRVFLKKPVKNKLRALKKALPLAVACVR